MLFSYYYLAAGSFPQGGPPSLALALPNTILLLASSAAVGWAQWGIEHNSKRRLVLGLGLLLLGGAAALAGAIGFKLRGHGV